MVCKGLAVFMRRDIQLSLLLVLLGWLASCAQRQELAPASSLLGHTEESILQCSGHPQQELRTRHTKILRYYREETMLDESRVASKGSFAGKHHGCWASLLVENDRIAGVEFRPVPNESGSPYLCEILFKDCSQ